jgi:glycosyltransferase involved in cell wall biosynthesis
MDIVVAHPSLNRGGGAEKVCLTAISALMKKGYRVTLATIDRTDWPFLRETFGETSRPSREFYLMDEMNTKGMLQRAVLTLSCYLPELVLMKTKDQYDVMLNTYGDFVDSIADISYINAVPLRITHRYPASGFSRSALWRIMAQGYGFSLGAVDKIFPDNTLVANSKFTQDIVSRFLRRRSEVVYPPVETEKFRAKTVENSQRQDLVTIVSRLRRGKQLDLVAKIAKLSKKGKFLILGLADEASQDATDSLMRTIKSLKVNDRIELLINQPFQKLADALASSKLFLSSQRSEAFGMAVVEAMASGCVPLVPRDGGPWFDVLDQEQGKYGYSYRNVGEAARWVDKLLGNESLREETSTRARVRASHFDSSIFQKEFLNVVQRVYMKKQESWKSASHTE